MKPELKIGMFPEKVIIEFLEGFYFKKIPFFDKTRKVSSINLQKDPDSLLRE
jgi:hypothetical protein